MVQSLAVSALVWRSVAGLYSDPAYFSERSSIGIDMSCINCIYDESGTFEGLGSESCTSIAYTCTTCSQSLANLASGEFAKNRKRHQRRHLHASRLIR